MRVVEEERIGWASEAGGVAGQQRNQRGSVDIRRDRCGGQLAEGGQQVEFMHPGRDLTQMPFAQMGGA